MKFVFENGTQQQQQWVQDAVDRCKFPTEAMFWVTVSVAWGAFPGNADTRHPYMVTQPTGGDTFLVTIAPWADDPTNGANLGLPDPEGDIQEFYMQSFVHELGHIVTDMTFNPGGADTDPRIGEVCALFWHPEVDSGPGRRVGTIADWDAPGLSWADEIREAVAEVFKVTYYTGRLIYMNRTNWKIDPKPFAQLVQFWTFKTPDFHEDFSQDAAYDPATGMLGAYVVVGNQETNVVITDGMLTMPQLSPPAFFDQEAIEGTVGLADTGVASCFIANIALNEPDHQQVSVEVGAIKQGQLSPHFSAALSFTQIPFVSGNSPINSLNVRSGTNEIVDQLPGMLGQGIWLVCNVDKEAGTVTAEIWATDPSSGGSPTTRVQTTYQDPGSLLLPYIALSSIGADSSGSFVGTFGTGSISVNDWRWGDHDILPTGDYQFPPGDGFMLPGPAAAGHILIGASRL